MATYKKAIQWLVDNDDNDWVEGKLIGKEGDQLSVSACMVADLFAKPDAQVAIDLHRAMQKERSLRSMQF